MEGRGFEQRATISAGLTAIRTVGRVEDLFGRDSPRLFIIIIIIIILVRPVIHYWLANFSTRDFYPPRE